MTVEFSGSIPARPSSPASPPGAVADGLPDADFLSLLVRHSQPLSEVQRAGLQRLLQQLTPTLATLIQTSPTGPGPAAGALSSSLTDALINALLPDTLRPAGQQPSPPASAQAGSASLLQDLPRLATLLSQPSLHLLKAQSPAGDLLLLSPKPARAGVQLLVQATMLGLRVGAATTPPPQAPSPGAAAPPTPDRPVAGPARPASPATPPTLQEVLSLLQRLRAGVSQIQIQQGLRQSLPSQQAAHQNLQALQRQGAALTPDHPVSKVTAALSDKAALSLPVEAAQLRQQLADSGLFTENRLSQWLQAGAASPPAQAGSDTKLLLWQLLNLLKPADSSPALTTALAQAGKSADPPSAMPAGTAEQMKTQVKQWLARILNLQLGSLSTDTSEPGTKLLQFELPLKWDQQLIPLHLQFQRQWTREEDQDSGPQHATRKVKPQWQVTLNLDIPGKGHLDARVRFSDQTLHCSLWADQPDTLAQIRATAGQLADGLNRRGLQLSPIQCFPGRLPSAAPIHPPLLDTHA